MKITRGEKFKRDGIDSMTIIRQFKESGHCNFKDWLSELIEE